MPRRNLPPYVQVLWKGRKPNRTLRGYRGWWMRGSKRCFGPIRPTADEAHRDAVKMRDVRDSTTWGGAFETRANDWLDSLKVTATPDTLDFYRGKLANIYRTVPRSMPVDRITAAVLREFVREAREVHHLGNRTVQHCRRTLNGFFRWLVRRGFVRDNPVPNVEWPKPVDTRPDVFTRAELVDVLARVTDPWAAALGMFAACSGLRRAELARLRVADVDAVNRTAWVRGKSRDQNQAIADDADGAVALLLAAAKGREFVIPGGTDRSRRNTIAETFRHWQKKLGEPRWHSHALRHSMITIMLRDGAPQAAVQRAGRHASYATTQRYANLIADDVRAAQSRLRLLPKVEEKGHG